MGASSFVSATKWLRDMEKIVGAREAIVLQEVLSWVEYNAYQEKNFRDGRYWVYNTYAEWEKHFPLIKNRMLRTAFKNLESKGILLTGNYNKRRGDQTKWYTVNFAVLDEIYPENANFEFCARLPVAGQNDQVSSYKGQASTYKDQMAYSATYYPNQMAPHATPLPDQDLYTDQDIIRHKDKGLKTATVNARARNSDSSPYSVDSDVFARPNINEPTHKLIKEYGESAANEAMAIVARYIEKWYQKSYGEPHPDTPRTKRNLCAAKILDCMATLGLRYMDINEAFASLLDSVLLGRTKGIGGNEKTNPTIIYACMPKVLGNWLDRTGAVTHKELAGTIYEIE